MSMWKRALDAAGIGDPALREDYTRQKAEVTRFKRSASLAVRLLLPPRLVPHVIAATAFMHHGDDLLDSGPREERAAAYGHWEKRVRDALATGGGDDPLLGALAHTAAAHPRLRTAVDEYLATARADLDFTGFATGADHQRYVDAYSLPAFMLVACLLAPADGERAFRGACRVYIDAAQRLDFVNDLAEDLREGRLTLPRDALDRHGVTRADLEAARDLPGTRDLLRELIGEARRILVTARSLVDLTPPEGRPLVRALIALDLLTADAAEARGPALLHAPARPPAPAALRVLAHEYRTARRLRQGLGPR
jgi:15-cis-phytoene synthase